MTHPPVRVQTGRMPMKIYERVLPDGRVLYAYPLTFNRGRLSIGPAGAGFVDSSW